MDNAKIRPVTHGARAKAGSEVSSSNHTVCLNPQHIYPEAKRVDLQSFSLPQVPFREL